MDQPECVPTSPGADTPDLVPADLREEIDLGFWMPPLIVFPL